MRNDRARITNDFDIPGACISCEPYGNGHIHDTYLSCWQQDQHIARYIHQRLNTNVFKDPVRLMDNVDRVTSHIQKRLGAGDHSIEMQGLRLIPAKSGGTYHRDDQDNYWRTYDFIGRSRAHDVCTTPEMAFGAARAFGNFQQLLTDLPGEPLHETIPWFHHTPRRVDALKESITENPLDRRKDVSDEIAFVLARKPTASIVTDLLENGEIPERVAHNDTKINNVLFSEHSEQPVCIIDLDTVMLTSVLYDFGDMVRTFTLTSEEDERNLSSVGFDMNFFEALAEGYMTSMGQVLTEKEIGHLAFSGRLITYTVGVRFLTDYLAGDIYFKTSRPGHNLERARAQFRLLELLEEHHDAMDGAIKSMARK